MILSTMTGSTWSLGHRHTVIYQNTLDLGHRIIYATVTVSLYPISDSSRCTATLGRLVKMSYDGHKTGLRPGKET